MCVPAQDLYEHILSDFEDHNCFPQVIHKFHRPYRNTCSAKVGPDPGPRLGPVKLTHNAYCVLTPALKRGSKLLQKYCVFKSTVTNTQSAGGHLQN